MIKELTLEDTRKYILDDSVRPHISAEFRTSEGRQVWALYDDESVNVLAVICVAYATAAPKNELELDWFSSTANTSTAPISTAVFYTVWSYTAGAGQRIVIGVATHIQQTRPEITRWVTLSPLTEMARRFHTRNGALLHSVHDTCQIFEYTHVLSNKDPSNEHSRNISDTLSISNAVS